MSYFAYTVSRYDVDKPTPKLSDQVSDIRKEIVCT